MTAHITIKDPSSYELRRYTPEWQQQWDDFVEQSRNGTIFHLQKFLGYHAPGKFHDHSLLFSKGGRLVAVFPAAERNEDGGRSLVSHPGSSYGGLVFDDRLTLLDVMACVENLVAHARAEGFQEVRMRLPERVFHKKPSEELDSALWFNGFRFKGREISAAIPLDFGEAEIWERLKGGSARSAARKAMRSGITVSESDDYGAFWPIVEQNLATRHHAKPTHTREEMERIKALFPDGAHLFAAFKDGAMVAGIWALVCNSKGIHTFYVAQDYRYQTDRPLNLVFVELMRWALRKGFQYINLGISTDQGGTMLDEGLHRFKESIGGRGVMRDIYFLRLTSNEKAG